MNKIWIEHSHSNAECCREDLLDINVSSLARFEYLDTMGLFETSWMIYKYHNNKNTDHDYGYPSNE